MRFLSQLFKKNPAYIHPVLGAMSFVKIDARKSYWEGYAYFSPTRTTIGFFIDGDESGVAAGTGEFFAETQTHYCSIIASFRSEIERQMLMLTKKPIPEEFDSAYRVSGISVPDMKIRNEWILSFDCLFDSNFSVSIELTDWDHGTVVIDS